MRLLHVTDTHLGLQRLVHRPNDGSPRSDLVARDAENALRAALAPALHGEVDLVVHTGDLFDRSQPPRKSVLFAAELLVLASRRVPVVVMSGNHDRRGLQRYLPAASANLHIFDRPTRLELPGVALGVVPYERSAAGFAVAAQVAVGPGVDLLLCHQAFDGQTVPTQFERGPGGEVQPSRWFGFRPAAAGSGGQADTIGEAHLPRGVRWVLSGHLHPRQVVEVGGSTVVCPGSTVRTSFAERCQTKGCAVWSLDREVTWAFRDLPSRPMRVIDDSPGGQAELAAVRPGDLVRLAASSVSPEAVWGRGGWLSGHGAKPRRVRSEAPPTEPADQLSLL